ncbi:hypothetical protein C8J57DRAFT_1165478 [Mycena rebaudengoi]|nr:hypothetical protein C8J57DRAFT_1165478 [Mycena rebaudengoi]
MSRIYRHPTKPTVDIPQLDLLTFLFDSEHSFAQDDALVLHVDAADPSNRVTKATLRSLTQRIAHGLRAHFNIGARGPNTDIVTVISGGQVLVPAAFFGIIAAGGVYSAASPSSTPADLARQVRIGTSRLVIADRAHAGVAREAAAQCGLNAGRVVLVLDSSPGRWSLKSVDRSIDALSDQMLEWERVTNPKALEESLITILWSSGTTGLPKGVRLSHLNLVAETYITALSARDWLVREFETNPSLVPTPYRTLGHLPVSHIAGLFGYMVGPMYSAGTVFWLPRYSWADLLRYVERHEITVFYTVPSIFLRITKDAAAARAFRFVEGASTGAAPMDAALQRAASAKLGEGGKEPVRIGQTWGLSETTGAVTAMPRGDADADAYGSLSPVLPGVELRIVDEEMRDVEEGEEGELLVRSVLVTRGYFRNEDATRAAFWDGWFCTGDVGVVREGRFYLVDRKKEILKYKGQQVAPAELENVLFTHPRVNEAAVIGVPAPDDPGNDLPRAYVVVDDRGRVTAEEIAEYVRARVAPYKQLRGGVVFVDEIPKNAVGKFLRRDLRERAKREMRETGAKL